jgi:hypothetical protein
VVRVGIAKYPTCVEGGNFSLIALPEVAALVEGILRCRPGLLIWVIGIHDFGNFSAKIDLISLSEPRDSYIYMGICYRVAQMAN